MRNQADELLVCDELTTGDVVEPADLRRPGALPCAFRVGTGPAGIMRPHYLQL